MNELWFTPSSLAFQSVHVRGPTDWVFLQLGASDGVYGIAEITKTQLDRDVAPIAARLANRLRGERITSDLDVLRLNGLTAADCEADQALATAVSGLRCAVMDALAKRAQLPLGRFLRATNDHAGEPEERIRLYANINRSMLEDDRGPVDRSPDAFAEMAGEAMAAGFTTAKCAPFDEARAPFAATGLPVEAEAGLDRIRSAKGVVGPDRTLYVDCHSRFDLDSGRALAPELRDAGAGWYEEPVDPVKDQKILREIREVSDLPMAGAERSYGMSLFARLIEDEILDIVMPDVKFCGGPAEAYQIGRELEAEHPGSVSMHCPSGPVSLLASAHTTAAFGNTLPLEHAIYEVDWRHEVLQPNERVEEGWLILPDEPGLGAFVDPMVVDQRGKSWEP